MGLLVHSTDDARRGLIGAMRYVATAGVTRPFVGDEAALVRSMAETVGHLHGDAAMTDLADLIARAEPWSDAAQARRTLASWLRTEHDRAEAMHAAILVALFARRPDAGALHAARDIAQHLGADTEILRDLEATASRDAVAAEADIFRRMLAWKTGVDAVRDRLAAHRQVVDTPPAAVEALRRTLTAAGPGTVGAELARYYDQTGFPIPGSPGEPPLAIIGRHDAHHVLTAYSTAVEDEICVAVFTAANARADATAYLAVVLLQWHQGIRLGFFDATRSKLDPHRIAAAAERGDRTTTDITTHDWDWLSLLAQPIDDVRSRYGIPPGGSVGPGVPWTGPTN
jgi:hypothetical protein